MKKDEQANVLLSLKNLYRLFTVKDYPVYSTGILGEKSKKGLTLVRFWDEYLLYEWKSTRHGKMIFRKDGSQNRYHSEFCNRKESFPLYQVYLQEVLECLNAETFGSQILIFEKFLKEKNYNHSVFVQKMRKFLDMAMESDPWLSRECGEKLTFWINYIFFQILWGCLVLYHALSACNGRSGNVRSENGTGKEPGGLKTEAYLELYLPEFRGDQAEFSYSTKL